MVGIRGIPDVPGGVEAHCAELYPRLADSGLDVTVYGRKAYVTSGVWRGVRVEALSSPNAKGLEAAAHAFAAVLAARRSRCQVLHFHSVGSGVALPLARLLGMRTVFTVHAPDYCQKKWGRFARTYLRLGERLGVRFADAVITVSQAQRVTLEAKYGKTVHVQPNGGAVVQRRPAGTMLESLGLKDRPYVLFVGRLIPDKRVEDLIAAAPYLAGDTQVVIVGSAARTDEYEKTLKIMAGNRVVFAGTRVGDELSELDSNARAFALPSAVEGLPVALIEALAYGVPAVAADIPGSREVLADGAAGRLVRVGDISGLAAAINGLLTDCAESARFTAAGHARAAATYDWGQIAAATRAIIMDAANRQA